MSVKFQNEETETFDPWFPPMLTMVPTTLETTYEINRIMRELEAIENEMGFVK